MCQLTFVDCRDEQAKRLILYIQMEENSRAVHRDGCGYFSTSAGLFKSQHPCSLITNMGSLTKNLGDRPVMGHVRNASQGVDKKVDVEHSHPFDSEHYILAHNGTLSFSEKVEADREKEYKAKEMIDSQMFLAELEKNSNLPTPEALVETMKLFCGKFAFLVFAKMENKFYVVRGKTATLFKYEFNIDGEQGFIINTEKDSLERGMIRASNILQVVGYDMTIDLKTAPVELKLETVFEVDEGSHSLAEKCSIIEKAREVPKTAIVTTYDNNYYRGYSGYGYGSSRFFYEKECNKILSFMTKHGLSIKDIDDLSYIYFGIPLAFYTTLSDLTDLLTLLEVLDSKYEKDLAKLWKNLTKILSSQYLYQKYPELKFPYFLTEKAAIARIALAENK